MLKIFVLHYELQEKFKSIDPNRKYSKIQNL